jgi:hypothetical protein
MSEFTVKTYADVADESPCDRKERIERTKRKYKQALETLCPSKDIRALAKRLAKRKCPCDKCVYCGGSLCNVPFSDGFMEDMEIDPCYMGILMRLRDEMGDSADVAVTLQLRSELDDANEALIAVCEATIAVINGYSTFKDKSPDMQKLLTALAGGLRNNAREILNDAISRKGSIEVNGDNHEKEAKQAV